MSCWHYLVGAYYLCIGHYKAAAAAAAAAAALVYPNAQRFEQIDESVLQLGSATSLETGSKRTREDMEASSTGRADLVSGDGGNSHTAATATSNATAPLASDATSEDNGSNSTTAEEASSKRMRASNGSSLEPQTSATKPPALDAIAEHRLFCPWRSAGATESSTLDAGWIGALSAMCKRNRGSSSSDRSSSGSADANTLTVRTPRLRPR